MNNSLFDDVRLVVGGWRWTRRRILPSLPRNAFDAGPGDVVFRTAWARSAIVRALREAGQAAALPLLLQSALDVTVGGTDRLQQLAQPAVFVANHASHLDALLEDRQPCFAESFAYEPARVSAASNPAILP